MDRACHVSRYLGQHPREHLHEHPRQPSPAAYTATDEAGMRTVTFVPCPEVLSSCSDMPYS